jgi:hypothetical protein
MKTLKLSVFTSLSTAIIFAVDIVPALAVDMLSGHAAVASPSFATAFLQQALLPAASSLFLATVSFLLHRMGQQTKISSLGQQHQILEQLAYQGIAKAEELAARNAGAEPSLSGEDKLNLAVEHVRGFLPSVGEDLAKSMVHAVLAQVPGIGASGDTSLVRYAAGGGAAVAAPMVDPGPCVSEPKAA